MAIESDIYQPAHRAVANLYQTGPTKKKTMRHSDESCLTVPGTLEEPEQIKLIRTSRQVFARDLNISELTLKNWEIKSKRPSAIEHYHSYWRRPTQPSVAFPERKATLAITRSLHLL